MNHRCRREDDRGNVTKMSANIFKIVAVCFLIVGANGGYAQLSRLAETWKVASAAKVVQGVNSALNYRMPSMSVPGAGIATPCVSAQGVAEIKRPSLSKPYRPLAPLSYQLPRIKMPYDEAYGWSKREMLSGVLYTAPSRLLWVDSVDKIEEYREKARLLDPKLEDE